MFRQRMTTFRPKGELFSGGQKISDVVSVIWKAKTFIMGNPKLQKSLEENVEVVWKNEGHIFAGAVITFSFL